MLFISVTEAGEAGALDSVSTTARNRRIFAWRKTGLDLRVLSRVRRPDGRDEFSARCDTRVGRRRTAHPVHTPKQAAAQGFPPRGARRPVMTAAGLVVTDVSHLGVGLDIRGDFRGPVRFAVSSQLSRPARTMCSRINVLRGVWRGR